MAKTKGKTKENSTTIKIAEKTKERLDHLKEYPGESYDVIINKNLNILNICLRRPGLAARILRDIEKSKKRKELIENPETATKKKPAAETSITRNMEVNVQRMKRNITN
jgi:hypothetical protein